MMLKPSIDKLLDKVPSRYSLVILQAKRAMNWQLVLNLLKNFRL